MLAYFHHSYSKYVWFSFAVSSGHLDHKRSIGSNENIFQFFCSGSTVYSKYEIFLHPCFESNRVKLDVKWN